MHKGFRQGDIARLLRQQNKIQGAHAEAAINFRHGHAGQTQLRQLRPQCIGAAGIGTPQLADELRRHLVAKKIPHRLLKQELVFSKGKIHGDPSYFRGIPSMRSAMILR